MTLGKRDSGNFHTQTKPRVHQGIFLRDFLTKHFFFWLQPCFCLKIFRVLKVFFKKQRCWSEVNIGTLHTLLFDAFSLVLVETAPRPHTDYLKSKAGAFLHLQLCFDRAPEWVHTWLRP